MVLLFILSNTTANVSGANPILPHLTKTNITDTIPDNNKKQTDKKNNKENSKSDTEPVKEVPTARHQSKPKVVAPNIKVKPVKIMKPKIKVK